jgi:hypothetical protein
MAISELSRNDNASAKPCVRWSRALAALSWTSLAKWSLNASSVSCASKAFEVQRAHVVLVGRLPARHAREALRAIPDRPRAPDVRALRRGVDRLEPPQRTHRVGVGLPQAPGHVGVGGREQARGAGDLGVVEQVCRRAIFNVGPADAHGTLHIGSRRN